MELTKKEAYDSLADFFTKKPFVLFGTGTSCALDLNFGMPALEQHLRIEFSATLTGIQEKQWQKVIAALDDNQYDFESAMDFISDDDLTTRIVESTANFIASHDNSYSHQIITGELDWPAGSLLQKLVGTLPSMDRQLHVATPNYDLLAEYAFVRYKIPYITGFYGGYFRYLDWEEAKKSVQVLQRDRTKNRSSLRIVECNHIRLHKPHGSLNTFELDNQLIECDGWILNKPDSVVRSMITPGTGKYKRLHKDRAQLAEYDASVKKHTSFLFLGFGFNDSQLINNDFRKKLEHDQCHALIITRDLNRRIEEWIHRCPNMWVICKQEDTEKTRIYNSKFQDWLYIDDKELWRFDSFTREFLGG